MNALITLIQTEKICYRKKTAGSIKNKTEFEVSKFYQTVLHIVLWDKDIVTNKYSNFIQFNSHLYSLSPIQDCRNPQMKWCYSC